MDDDDMPEDFEDKLDEVKEAAEEMLDDEEQTLVTLDIYMNAATNASYVQAETPVMEGSATHVSVINNPSETGAQVEVSVLVKTPMPSYSADGTQVAPALETPIDWQKVRQDIISGQDPTGVMIDVTMDSSEDTAANKIATDAQIKIQASGMPFTISITGDETLTGNYEANNSFSIAVLSPAPLITFTQKSVQTDKQPALPDMSNLTEVVLSEEMTEEDMAPLTKILTEQTLPQLMENLKKALPEEAGILMLLLQPQPEEGAITQVN
jgi:molybdopterin converting factor small subunit